MNRFSIGAALVFLAATAAAVSGCAQNDVQLGSGEGVGDWVGYAENHPFFSGSDSFVVHITGLSGEVATGTVRLGDAPDLPPPADPDKGYPADIHWESPGAHRPGGAPYEGFTYTLEDGVFTGERLKGTIYSAEVWAAWCEMQAPLPHVGDPSRYGCVPNGAQAWTPDGCTDDGTAFDGDKMYLCAMEQRTCDCDASGCHQSDSLGRIELDLKVDGDHAHGSIVGHLGTLQETNVWLTRAPNE